MPKSDHTDVYLVLLRKNHPDVSDYTVKCRNPNKIISNSVTEIKVVIQVSSFQLKHHTKPQFTHYFAGWDGRPGFSICIVSIFHSL